ncbi:MAG: GtrA family protein [Chloroflexi bacterium]|nr:GtrA family protein [Chloroflexota bacterium]
MNQTNTLKAADKSTMRNPLDIPIVFIANRFGPRSKEVERFIKFAIVGAIGAIIDFGLVFILQATILPPANDLSVVLAVSAGFIAAVLSNFTWNRLWTYPDSRSRSIRRQLAQFAIINFIGWAIRTLWVKFVYLPLGAFFMPILLPEIRIFRPGYIPTEHGEAKLGTMIALLIGVVVVMVWNFFANRYWTYSDVN